MSRKVILEVPLVLIAAIVVAVAALVYWLILLIPFLIKPSLVRPLQEKCTDTFTSQFGKMLASRRRQTKLWTAQPSSPSQPHSPQSSQESQV